MGEQKNEAGAEKETTRKRARENGSKRARKIQVDTVYLDYHRFDYQVERLQRGGTRSGLRADRRTSPIVQFGPPFWLFSQCSAFRTI